MVGEKHASVPSANLRLFIRAILPILPSTALLTVSYYHVCVCVCVCVCVSFTVYECVCVCVCECVCV